MAYRYPLDARASTARSSVRSSTGGGYGGTVARRAAPVPEEKRIEAQYVQNLQQQVYILEVELRMLREHALQNENNQASLLASTLANSGGNFATLLKDLQEVECKTSEEYLALITSGLKKIDVEFQHKIDKEIKEKAELEFQNSELNQVIAHLNQEKKEMAYELENLRASLTSEKDVLSHKSIRRKNKMQGLRQDLQAVQEEREKIHARWQQDSIQQETQYKQLQEEHNILMAEKQHCQKRITDLEAELCTASFRIAKFENDGIEAQRKQLIETCDALREQKTALEVSLKQSEVRAMQYKQGKEKLEADCAELVAQSVNYQNTINDHEQRALEIQKQKDRMAKAAEEQSRLIIHLRSKVEKHKGRRRTAEDEERENQRMKQLASQRHQISSLEERLGQRVAELEQKDKFCHEIQQRNAQLTHDNRSKDQLLDERKELIEKNTALIQDLQQQIIQLKTHTDQLRKKLKLSMSVEALKAADINSLKQTNLAVARQISSLVRSIQSLGDVGPVGDDDDGGDADSASSVSDGIPQRESTSVLRQ